MTTSTTEYKYEYVIKSYAVTPHDGLSLVDKTYCSDMEAVQANWNELAKVGGYFEENNIIKVVIERRGRLVYVTYNGNYRYRILNEMK